MEIARSVIALAHSLGRIAVAGCVEREAQAELLRSMGCDAIQGFLVCRPVPAGESDAFLAVSAARIANRGGARVIDLAGRRHG